MAMARSLLGLVLLSLLPSSVVGARHHFVVNQPTDGSGACPGPECSLSSALKSIRSGNDYLITFQAGLTSIKVGGEVMLQGIKAASVTIEGVKIVTVSPTAAGYRWLNLQDTTLNVTINEVAFKHFKVTDAPEASPAGAVIYGLSENNPSLYLVDCLFEHNVFINSKGYTVIGGVVSWTCGDVCDLWSVGSSFFSNNVTVGLTATNVFGGVLGLFSPGTLYAIASDIEGNSLVHVGEAKSSVGGSALGAAGNMFINETVIGFNKGGLVGFAVYSEIGTVITSYATFIHNEASTAREAGVVPSMMSAARIKMFETTVMNDTDSTSTVTVSTSDQYFSSCKFTTMDGSPPQIGAYEIINRDPFLPVWTNATSPSGKGPGFADCAQGKSWLPCPTGTTCENLLNPSGVVWGYKCKQ